MIAPCQPAVAQGPKELWTASWPPRLWHFVCRHALRNLLRIGENETYSMPEPSRRKFCLMLSISFCSRNPVLILQGLLEVAWCQHAFLKWPTKLMISPETVWPVHDRRRSKGSASFRLCREATVDNIENLTIRRRGLYLEASECQGSVAEDL